MKYPLVFSPLKHLQIHLNRCEDASTLQDVIATLSPVESLIFSRISSRKRQNEFLSLRKFLQNTLEKTVHVHYDVNGKPFIPGEDLELSVSHSDGFIAFALNKNEPAGIDIQVPRPQIMNITEKFMNNTEHLQADNDLLKTTLIWCAKEAMYKWYAKKKVKFAWHMHVVLGSDQKIEGSLLAPDKNHRLQLEYRIIDDLPLVYVL